MIYTVTLNPAIDYYIEIDKFQEKKLNISKDAYTIIGGKGINVSSLLNNFKKESIALGFVGAHTGKCIKDGFKDMGMREEFSMLEEPTRINIKLKTLEGETEIAGKAPKITDENLKDFFEKISKIKAGDKLVLSGSVPPTLKTDIYVKIMEKIPSGIDIVLDTRGEAFSLALKKGVFLTKPNKKELEDFLGRKVNSLEEIIEAGKELQKMGSKNVIISLGAEGSICLTENKVLIGNAPKGNLVSSVGAGDSMVAGLLYAMEEGKSFEEAYSYAIASGSSTAFSEGLTTFEDMLKVREEVIIKNYK